MSVVRLWVRRNNVDEVPTPVDPAHIQPGDVFCVTYEATCKRVTKSGIVFGTNGYAFDPRDDDGATWFLVHRPDPDAEAVEALARFLHDEGGCGDPFGDCISTTENYRNYARRIIEFQRRQS